jgi:hypothetical protein
VGFNKEVAGYLAEEALSSLRRRSYDELSSLLDDSIVYEVTGDDGKLYTVEAYAITDADDAIRVCVAVDDGGFSAFKPLVRDFIIRPDGTFVDEAE